MGVLVMIVEGILFLSACYPNVTTASDDIDSSTSRVESLSLKSSRSILSSVESNPPLVLPDEGSLPVRSSSVVGMSCMMSWRGEVVSAWIGRLGGDYV
jgi:hypothetical protein